ncbi:MAG: (d)CMP kinase [Candidatus Poribacteria bacterium]|nr:(d)CMP kinase [Candidatus Poribacteria bacterium]MDE0506893.1 (d)CMP kinase [Candidatus Poribacteria bacterium]
MNESLTIAMDGPAGSGKSSVARRIAEKIGYLFLNSGAMYRAVTLLADRSKIPCTDITNLIELAHDCQIDFTDNGKITLLNGEDVSHLLHTPEIDKAVVEIAKIPEVRRAMVKQQRRIGKDGGIVVEGRDVTTVVFPDAEVKFYIDASVQERAKRRFLELQDKEVVCTVEQIEQEIKTRDETDASRAHSPLRPADDAIIVDTTDKSLNQVVDFIIEQIDAHT